jgi:prepilin-type N-terminal cleavage/methylation domain-containing protein
MARGDDGVTLVELVIAMAIFALVVISVDSSVTVLNGRANGLSRSNQAIDQLQIAEETITRDVHAANSWCTPLPNPANGCGAFTRAPTTTDLYFTSSINGATPTIEFKLVTATGSKSLTMSTNLGAPVTLLSNLDPSSTFTVQNQPVVYQAPNGTTYDFYTSVGVVLTMDSPIANSALVTKTTLADTTIQVWNVEYACSATKGSPC